MKKLFENENFSMFLALGVILIILSLSILLL